MYKSFNVNNEITVWCEGKPSCDDSGKNQAERGKQRGQTMQRNLEVLLNVLTHWYKEEGIICS